jgi:oligoribonuclease (3'-5' exoribonuclease)
MKEMFYRTKVHTTEESLRQIMDAAAYIHEHSELIQRAVNSCMKRARLCIENRGRHFEQLQDVLHET